MGEMEEGGGNFGCSMEKWGLKKIGGLKKSKNKGLIGNKAVGGKGALVKAPEDNWGEMGGKRETGEVPEILDARWKDGEFGG